MKRVARQARWFVACAAAEVLYSLGDPVSLVLLLIGALLAVTLQGVTHALVAGRAGDPRPAREGRTKLDPRHHLDPFGAVAALIAGIGWTKPLDPPERSSRATVIGVLLSGALVNIALGLGLLVAYSVAGGVALGGGRGVVIFLQYGFIAGSLGVRALFLIGLSLLFFGALALVPLPPLPGGRLLFALAPNSVGWQKARYQLVERNIGVAILLALLLIPLGGPQALLPDLLDTLLGPLVALVTGG